MNKETYKKVYIFCPANYTTGGPETLHYICDIINNNGGDAYMFYNKKGSVVPKPYTIYNVKVADKIEDSSENLFVVSEPYTDLLFKYKKVKKAIVFLSVEYYIKSKSKFVINNFLKERKLPKFFYPLVYLYAKMRKWNMNTKFVNLTSDEYLLSCNGQVNKKFLVELGVNPDKIAYVCGPLNKEFLEEAKVEATKENVIAYNPKKGYEYTKLIIEKYNELYNDAKFIPIQNMTPAEVHDLLRSAKLYIDFGNHPGPERIPREAVVSGCNIITSRNGSANFYEDVPIKDEYKFDCNNLNVDEVCRCMNKLIVNYEEHKTDFDVFREKVFNQPEIFKENVLNTFLRK